MSLPVSLLAGGDQYARTGTEQDVVGRRMVAALLDSVLVFAVLYAGLVTVGGLGMAHRASLAPGVIVGFYLWYVFSVLGFAPLLVLHDYSGIWFVVGVGLWAVYGTLFEAAIGATPGKLLTGIVVTTEDGTKPGLTAVVVRNALRAVDSLGFYFLGFVIMAMSSRRQRLGDRLGDTVVVRRG
jgi:uncharacterized RDD family membrane protein YckC